jgi:hypothetical protein
MVLVAPYLLAISNAATKHQHYAYSLFPFLSVAAAGLLFAGLPPRAPPDGSGDGQTRRSLAIAGVTAAIFIVQHDFRMIRAHMRVPRFDHPVVRLSAAMESDLSTGRSRLILYKFPPPVDLGDFTLGFSFHDHYYVPRVRSAVHARSVEELRALLADGTPAVVVLPPLLPADQLIGALPTLPDRSFLVRSSAYPYPVLTVHGVEQKFHLGEVLGEIEVPVHPAPKW